MTRTDSKPEPSKTAISRPSALRRAAWSLAFEAELDLRVTRSEQGVELQSWSFALKAGAVLALAVGVRLSAHRGALAQRSWARLELERDTGKFTGIQ
jgi:hypothetical protein